jgi:hypothetical protein
MQRTTRNGGYEIELARLPCVLTLSLLPRAFFAA